MQIYLAKPGGQKEGPFTLDQVQRELAAGRIRDNEYWAWHEGLPQWMPLYEVPGIVGKLNAAKPVATPPAPMVSTPRQVQKPEPAAPEPAVEPEPEPMSVFISEPEPVAAADQTPIASAEFTREPEEPQAAVETTFQPSEEPQPIEEGFIVVEPEPEPAVVAEQEEPAPANPEDSSGFPFAALEQIFIFTSGEGRAVFDSAIVVRKLRAIVGHDLDAIRGKVFVDVIGRANVGADIMIEGGIPDKAWRAMSGIRPFMTQRAKDQSCEICVRPFSTETHDAVALVLLYDRKQCALAAV